MAVFEVDNEKELERLNKELENGLDWIECLDVKLPSSFKSELKDKEFDPENEIKREKAFLTEALEAAKIGINKLKNLKLSIHRPEDYLAQMVKSDKHMERIKLKNLSESKATVIVQARRNRNQKRKTDKNIKKLKIKNELKVSKNKLRRHVKRR